jgi:hypothetical protein
MLVNEMATRAGGIRTAPAETKSRQAGNGRHEPDVS